MVPAETGRAKEQAVERKETRQPDADASDISPLGKYGGAMDLDDRAQAIKRCSRLEWDAFLDHHSPANEMRLEVKCSDFDVADAELNSDEIGTRSVYADLDSRPSDLTKS